VECYVCLEEARDLAADLGDVERAKEALERLDATYVVDARVQRGDIAIRMLSGLSGLQSPPSGVLDFTFDQLEEAFLVEDYVLVETLYERVRPASAHIEAARERLREATRLVDATRAVAPALQSLKLEPGEPEANLAAARFYLLVRGDLTRGFERLRAVADQNLASLAGRELAVPASAAERLTVAVTWRAVGERPGEWQQFAVGREAHWLRAALATDAVPALDALGRRSAQDRLSALGGGLAIPGALPHPDAADAPRAERLPVPAEPEVAAERARLREYLAKDYAQDSIEGRKALSDKLLGLAEEAHGATRYALLDEALELALGAKDPGRTNEALLRLAADFAVDGLGLRTKTLARLGPNVQNSAADAFGELLLAHAERCLDQGRTVDVAQLLSPEVQSNFLRRSSNPAQKAEFKALRAELDQLLEIVALEERLRVNPSDFAVRLALGRHYAFAQGDLERGFEHLAQGSDETLRNLARKEREGPRDAEACIALAIAWKGWSDHELDPRGKGIGRERARHWGERALELGFDDPIEALAAQDLVDTVLGSEPNDVPVEGVPVEGVPVEGVPVEGVPVEGVRPEAQPQPETRAAFGVRRASASKEVRKAVERGVDWLLAARYDGHWDCADHGGVDDHDVGVTGLAVLALLASGERRAQAAIDAAVAWLLEQRESIDEPGEPRLIGEEVGHAILYGHALATLALCRVLVHTPRPELRVACSDAVRYIERARNPYGAWRYNVPPNGDNDTSVTAWMVAALEAADRVDIAYDGEALLGARNWFNEVTDPVTGRGGYQSIGSTSSRVGGANEDYPTEQGEAMTAAALYCRLLIGRFPGISPVMRQHAALIRKTLPQWNPGTKANDMYYWYYGSLAMHRMGGESWRQWKAALEGALLPGQVKDKDEDAGSWPPIGPWGWSGGRVYSTAIAVLSLTAAWQPR